MRLPALIAALAFILAGCSDGGTGDAGDDGFGTPDVQVAPDADTGAIAGVVVDQAIRPVGGVTVTLLSSGANATTGDDGQFVFEDLEPGTYFLEAVAFGFTTIQTSTDVRAGEVSRVRVQVEQTVFAMPYHETLHFTGYIEFSPGAAGSIANIIIDTGLGMENPLCTKCSFEFDTTGLNVTTFVVEGLWEDALPQPQADSNLYLEFYPEYPDGNIGAIEGGFLPAGFLERYDMAETWGNATDNTYWHARLTGAAETVQYNQQYELYVTTFIDGSAPEGWSFVAGDV